MEGLGSFLLFAAFFYFMMRFGCGTHMTNDGGHGKYRKKNEKGEHIHPSVGDEQ